MSLTLASRRHPAGFDRAQLPLSTNAVATSGVAAGKWQIDFTNPVNVIALPVDFLVNGQPPTQFSQSTATRITLTYAAAVAAGQSWVIPSHSANLRTYTGGYAAAAAGTF